jgi:methylthioribose-1-phosphate isomerase
MIIGTRHPPDEDHNRFFEQLASAATYLKNTRPTAVNLAWAVDRISSVVSQHREKPVAELKKILFDEAMRIYQEDRRINREIGEHGSAIIPQSAQIITHCNTGALATVDYGTALGVVFSAHAKGKKVRVWVDETRPLLQGARLNMWELMNEGIEATLICDNMSAFVMQKNKIDLCIVGADRIASNGDTANKIGTYGLAVAARHHGVPFYVAAPVSTIDFKIASGSEIPIEERAANEVTHGFGRQTAPNDAKVFSPAFDITPNELITGIITEQGIINPPYSEQIPALAKKT